MNNTVPLPPLPSCLLRKWKVLGSSTGKGGVVKQLQPAGLVPGHLHSVGEGLAHLFLLRHTGIALQVEVVDDVAVIKGNDCGTATELL